MFGEYKKEQAKEDLIKCPFCEGEAELCSCFHDHVDTRVYFVRCKSCGARGPRAYEFNRDEVMQKAIKGWNERGAKIVKDNEDDIIDDFDDQFEKPDASYSKNKNIFRYRHCSLVQDRETTSFCVFGKKNECLMTISCYGKTLNEKEAEKIIDYYFSLRGE